MIPIPGQAAEAGSAAASPLWRLHPLAELHWRNFSSEWVVYEAKSGQTACLDPVAAAVLMCFEDGAPHDEPQIREKLVNDFHLEADVPVDFPSISEQFRLLNFLVPLRPDVAVRAHAP